MSFKSITVSLSLATVVVLLGAGCLNQSQTTPTQDQPTAQPETATKIKTEVAVELTPNSPCPEDMVRFWNVHNFDGYTFCYYPESLSGEKVNVKNFGNKVVLYSGNNTSFSHSVLMLQTSNGHSIKQIIENEYIDPAGKNDCEVVENNDGEWTTFTIAAGDLEKQQGCGEFKDGFFRTANNNSDFAFYITIGQDTFMPDGAWLETLEPVKNLENGNATVAPANDFVSGKKEYSNQELGISFSYPADWGPVSVESEGGRTDDWNGSPKTEPNCTILTALTMNGIDDSALLLSGHDTADCNPYGRGGWFGDQAKVFSSWDEVLGWCGDGCDIFTNKNGIKVAHRHLINSEVWGTNYDDLDLYGIFHEGHELQGIILSNERLIDAGLGRSENELKELINSIKFLE